MTSIFRVSIVDFKEVNVTWVIMSFLLTLSTFRKLIFWFPFPINPIWANQLTDSYMVETSINWFLYNGNIRSQSVQILFAGWERRLNRYALISHQ